MAVFSLVLQNGPTILSARFYLLTPIFYKSTGQGRVIDLYKILIINGEDSTS
jgi:hypothetical protein